MTSINFVLVESRVSVGPAWREVWEHGFWNYGMRTTTGTPTIVYYLLERDI